MGAHQQDHCIWSKLERPVLRCASFPRVDLTMHLVWPCSCSETWLKSSYKRVAGRKQGPYHKQRRIATSLVWCFASVCNTFMSFVHSRHRNLAWSAIALQYAPDWPLLLDCLTCTRHHNGGLARVHICEPRCLWSCMALPRFEVAQQLLSLVRHTAVEKSE